MAQGLEADPPLRMRSQVAEMPGYIAMRCLVQGDRKNHRQRVDRDGSNQVGIHDQLPEKP
jgi:hypothetical protein